MTIKQGNPVNEIMALVRQYGLEVANRDTLGYDAYSSRAYDEVKKKLEKTIRLLENSNARQYMELSIIRKVIEDPTYEMSGVDWDYETELTTKVVDFAREARKYVEI